MDGFVVEFVGDVEVGDGVEFAHLGGWSGMWLCVLPCRDRCLVYSCMFPNVGPRSVGIGILGGSDGIGGVLMPHRFLVGIFRLLITTTNVSNSAAMLLVVLAAKRSPV